MVRLVGERLGIDHGEVEVLPLLQCRIVAVSAGHGRESLAPEGQCVALVLVECSARAEHRSAVDDRLGIVRGVAVLIEENRLGGLFAGAGHGSDLAHREDRT